MAAGKLLPRAGERSDVGNTGFLAPKIRVPAGNCAFGRTEDGFRQEVHFSEAQNPKFHGNPFFWEPA